MSERAQQRFAPHGALALNPKAFGMLFDMREQDVEELTENGVAVVTIRGPLMHHKEWCFDSYEAIKERVAAALALQPRFVLMSIDSPGGLVSGAFDTARDLRKMAKAAGVDLYAHVAGQATSAAYAIASSAMWIGVSQSASVGSIGVIDTLVDASAQNQMLGINVQLVTSGDRKADGNPAVAISDDALAASQRRVDTFARMFFELVAEHDWGGSVERIAALQAAIVTGEQAVELKLATEIATLDQSIAFASPEALRMGTGATATDKEKGRYTMATPIEDAVASLRKAAQGDDEDEAKKAKAALKALGFGDEDDDDDSKSTDDDDDDEEAKAAAKAAAKSQDDDDDDAKSQDDDDAEASSKVLKLAARVHNLEAASAAKENTEKRDALLATRPDISDDMRGVLSDLKMSDKQVRKFLKTLDVNPTRVAAVAAAATATGVRGDLQGDGTAGRLPPAERAVLDAQMGLTKMTTETVDTPHRLTFGVRRPVTQEGSK